jgi:hypothetical protein
MIESLGKRLAFAAPTACVLAAVLLCTSAHAQTGAALLLKPFPKEQFIDVSGSYLALDAGHVKQSDESARLSFYESAGRVRVIPGSLISPRIGWDTSYINLNIGSGALADFLPGQLLEQSLGVAFPIAKIDEWVLGLSFGLGYAGGSPYGESGSWYGKGTFIMFRQFGEEDALIFVLDYDRNRTFLPDVPLPGVAYAKRIDPTVFFVAGVPLTSVTWTPVKNLRVELGYVLVESFDVAVGYDVIPHLTLFGNLEYRNTGFFLDELGDVDRLFFQQRRGEVGVRWAPLKKNDTLGFTAAVGYAWGQEFSEGFDSRNARSVAKLSDEPYFRVGFEVKF